MGREVNTSSDVVQVNSIYGDRRTSPYHALYGREMVTGIDANLLLDFSKSPNMQSYMTHLVPRLKLTHDIIQQNLRDGQVKSKQHYDQSSEEPEMQVGEKVGCTILLQRLENVLNSRNGGKDHSW